MELDRIERLERVLLDTWPALESCWDQGWVWRANAGVTGRANSLSVLDPGTEVSARLDAVEAWYLERDLPALVRVTPLTGTEVRRELDRRGYEGEARDRSGAAVVMTKRLRAAEKRLQSVALSERPADGWWALSGRTEAERQTLARARSEAPSRAVYAAVGAGSVVGIGQAAVAHDHVAVFSMATAPTHRGRGIATAVLAALEHWGMRHGAHTATLQVVVDNAPARHLYDRAGYQVAYDYHYRRRNL